MSSVQYAFELSSETSVDNFFTDYMSGRKLQGASIPWWISLWWSCFLINPTLYCTFSCRTFGHF